MPSKVLNEKFIKTGLVCPVDKNHIEYTDADRTGLYIEVRSTSPGRGTWWFRFKNDSGKTSRVRIGRTTDISVKDAKNRLRILRGKRAMGKDIGADRKNQKSITWNQLMEDYYFSYKESKLSNFREGVLSYHGPLKRAVEVHLQGLRPCTHLYTPHK